MRMPLPDLYSAFRPATPVSSASMGFPVTLTGSSKVTVMLILEPMPYVAFALVEDTESTDGAAASIRMSAERPSEPFPPGSGSVRLAVLPTASVMTPSPAAKAIFPA